MRAAEQGDLERLGEAALAQPVRADHDREAGTRFEREGGGGADTPEAGGGDAGQVDALDGVRRGRAAVGRGLRPRRSDAVDELVEGLPAVERGQDEVDDRVGLTVGQEAVEEVGDERVVAGCHGCPPFRGRSDHCVRRPALSCSNTFITSSP